MKIIGDDGLLIEAARVQEFLLYGAEGPWDAVKNHIEESQSGIKLSAQAAATLCAVALRKEKSAAQIAVDNGMQVKDVMEAARQLTEAGFLYQESATAPKATALQGLLISEKGKSVLKKDSITQQHRNALELLQEKANTLEEFDLPPAWKSKLDALFPQKDRPTKDQKRLKPINEAQFASLCAIASNYLEEKTPDIRIGQTIAVSPRAMVILHEAAMKRAQGLEQVAKWYQIPEKKLRGSLQNLINCGLLLVDESQDLKGAKQIDLGALMLSENASRILENRRCSFEERAMVVEPGWGQHWFTEKGLRVAHALASGPATAESIAAMEFGLSVDGAVEMLAEFEQQGLLEKSGFEFKASLRLERALQTSCTASSWEADEPGILAIEKASVEELLELEKNRLEIIDPSKESTTGPRQKELENQQQREIEHQNRVDSEAKTLQRAVRIAQDKMVALLIEKGTKQNRTEFYAYELTSQVRRTTVPEKSNESIQHLAIEQMFKHGFLTAKTDFEEALKNGVHPTQYQPIVILSPLGDAQGNYQEFKEAHVNYENYRTQTYLTAINTHETQETGEICEDNDFDEDDFSEFLESPIGKELVGNVTKFDENNGIFYKGIVLNNDKIKAAKRHDVLIIDYLASIEPFSLEELTRVFPVSKEADSENALLTLLTRERIIEEAKDREAHYRIANGRPDKELAASMQKIWKKVTGATSLMDSIPETITTELHKNGYCSIKDYVGKSNKLLAKEASTALQKSGVVRRFRTKGGRIDYFFLNEQMQGLSHEQLKEEIERVMTGTGKTVLSNKFETKHLSLEEFTSKIQQHNIKLSQEEMPYYERAQKASMKMTLKTGSENTETQEQPSERANQKMAIKLN